MKTHYFILILLLFIVAGGAYFIYSQQKEAAAQTNTSTWKTYTDSEMGFSIKYPPQYAVYAGWVAIDTPWGSRNLLTIYDPADTSTNEFHVEPAGVTLQKQPIIASGHVYHTVAEYQQGGTAAQMVQGASNPNGTLVTVNGVQALMYHFPAGDATDAPSDSYFFMKDDLIYQVSFNANDPYKQGMLRSISWK